MFQCRKGMREEPRLSMRGEREPKPTKHSIMGSKDAQGYQRKPGGERIKMWFNESIEQDIGIEGGRGEEMTQKTKREKRGRNRGEWQRISWKTKTCVVKETMSQRLPSNTVVKEIQSPRFPSNTQTLLSKRTVLPRLFTIKTNNFVFFHPASVVVLRFTFHFSFVVSLFWLCHLFSLFHLQMFPSITPVLSVSGFLF